MKECFQSPQEIHWGHWDELLSLKGELTGKKIPVLGCLHYVFMGHLVTLLEKMSDMFPLKHLLQTKQCQCKNLL